MRIPLVMALALIALPSTNALAIDAVTSEPTVEVPWIAEYEGEEIDLRFGWDSAKACFADGTETTCYDTEAEMLRAVSALTSAPTAVAGASGLLRASCSSFLLLYSGTNYSGTVLGFSTQYVVHNLSNYGFNNVTSSYKIGGCGSYFWDLSSGGGTVYGGPTWAWAQAASMNAGWDNRLSSLMIS